MLLCKYECDCKVSFYTGYLSFDQSFCPHCQSPRGLLGEYELLTWWERLFKLIALATMYPRNMQWHWQDAQLNVRGQRIWGLPKGTIYLRERGIFLIPSKALKGGK